VNDEANIGRVARGERIGTVVATGRRGPESAVPGEPGDAADED
jgi:hypothetical protein